MEYISVAEASEKWEVSLRQVQRLLADGRIYGARKYGRSWMIPKDAEKPINLRKILCKQSTASDLAFVLESTTVPMPVDNPDTILDCITKRRLQLQYEGELAYLRGNFQRTIQCFNETEGDDAARLRACPVAIASAISLGDYHAYTKIKTYLKPWMEKGGHIAAIAQLALATSTVSVIAPNMAPDWLREGDFSSFPVQAKPDALYLRAKYFQCVGDYKSMLAVAQTALTLCASEQGVTLPDIYLRMSCAIACYSLEREEEAKRWLLNAMHIGLSHGFLTPFAESITALGGLVERCVEQSFPEYYNSMINQWKHTWKNWIVFHNQFAKENITFILSLREYHIALLAARHVPYSKIAKQYCVSIGRLKNIMLEIYEKLLISGRDELSKYIF